jgi:hypothetical protein
VIHLADAASEGDGACFVEPVRHGQRLGMIGDGDVFVSAVAAGFGHFFESRASIGFAGVHVEIAANVGALDELRKASVFRGFDLAKFSRSSGGIQARPMAP